MNFEEIAEAITKKEALKEQVNIAQVKEIVKIIVTDVDLLNALNEEQKRRVK